ncbi:MAG: cobyric acid synthase [Desulfobacterales bacterium]|nr:cobyric acid synthase [Desulfobacterales bacterium]
MKSKPQQAPCLAIFGTGSDVGKSVVTTGLCRALRRQAVKVAPYKAQNMSNNSGVTPEGLEMGRAQIVQAEAAGIPPHVDMNPILLKPTSEVGAQVVLLGQARANLSALEYHQRKDALFKGACGALDRIRSQYEVVLIEGAGSCAEVNLQAHDIVNFKVAEYADAPVILVADIHRGGVFAQVVGTMACLPPERRERIAGFIINRFRGDLRLFDDGVEWIQSRTGKPVFGVLPWYDHFVIEQEDSVVIEKPRAVRAENSGLPAIAVIRIPHISNFTDFDPLQALDGVDVHFIEQLQALDDFKAVILPGSKNTRYDLEWLHRQGWADQIRQFARTGGCVLGICGGYQMMGRRVGDPEGLEGAPGETPGLGLLPVETILKAPKTTTRTRFEWREACGQGYEIHMGQTIREGGDGLLRVKDRNREAADDVDGCQVDEGRIAGTYIHGLFDSPEITRLWLQCWGLGNIAVDRIGGAEARDRAYDQLAAHVAEHLDLPAITGLVRRA